MAIRTGRTSELSYKTINKTIFIFGPYRTGKTFFIRTMPNPHIICTEDGINGLADSGFDIPFTAVETFSDLCIVLNNFKKAKVPGVTSLILDDLSAITDIVIRSIVGDDRARSLSRNEWPGAVDKLRMAVANFVDCKRHYNVVCLARAILKEDDDPEGGTDDKGKQRQKLYGLPDTIGKFAHSVGGMFDFCFYSEYRDGWDDTLKTSVPAPILHTTSTGRFNVGQRVAPGRFPKEIPNDFEVLMKYLMAPRKWVDPRPAPLDYDTVVVGGSKATTFVATKSS